MAAKVKADGGGLRFNTGKNMIELLPLEWIWGVAMVTTRGSIKYAVRNWERGMKWSYLVGCAFRHMIKFVCGERYDKETGCHHLAMCAWNVLALMSYDIRQIGENDLVGNLDWLSAVAVEPGPELLALIAQRAKEGAKSQKKEQRRVVSLNGAMRASPAARRRAAAKLLKRAA